MTSCAVCGGPKGQERADKAATCGRACGALLANDTKAANRLALLNRRGLERLSKAACYAWGYKNGYQRRVDRDRKAS